MSSFLGETLVHLKSKDRPDVQKEAVKVLGTIFAGDSSRELPRAQVLETFVTLGSKGVLDSAGGEEMSYAVGALMVNILADYAYLQEMEDEQKIDAMVKRICSRVVLSSSSSSSSYTSPLPISNVYLALLNNLTTSERVCTAVAGSLLENKMFSCMLQAFLEYNPQLEEEAYSSDYDWAGDDPWQYMAHILCNFARVEDVRTFLFQLFEQNYIAAILKQMKTKNPTRRRGVVATLRSLLFKEEWHWRLVEEENCLLYLLSPLVVGQEAYEGLTPFTDKDRDGMDVMLWCQAELPTKRYEPDQEILCLIIDCLRLLCMKRVIRYELRKRKVYPILRNLDLALVDDESLHERLFQPIRDIVDFIQGDEDPDEEAKESQSHEFVHH